MMAGIMSAMKMHKTYIPSLQGLVLLASLAFSSAAWAQTAQPVSADLQPLYTRREEIMKAQLVQTQIIQSPAASPQQRAQAKVEYQKLEAEKQHVLQEIARAQMTGNTGSVNYGIAGPAPAAPTSAPPAAPPAAPRK